MSQSHYKTFQQKDSLNTIDTTKDMLVQNQNENDQILDKNLIVTDENKEIQDVMPPVMKDVFHDQINEHGNKKFQDYIKENHESLVSTHKTLKKHSWSWKGIYKFDSPLMKAVNRTTKHLVNLLGGEISANEWNDRGAFSKKLTDINKSYDNAITATKDYIEARKDASTDSGKYRLEMVRKTQARLLKEKETFATCAWQVFNNAKDSKTVPDARNWTEVLYMARALEFDTKQVGKGITNSVQKIQIDGKTKYYKQEQVVLDKEHGNIAAMSREKLAYYENLSDQKKEEILNGNNENEKALYKWLIFFKELDSNVPEENKLLMQDIYTYLSEYFEGEEYKFDNYVDIIKDETKRTAFKACLDRILAQNDESKELIKGFKIIETILAPTQIANANNIAPGAKLNLRNVGTSRMADFLFGDTYREHPIVAKSVSVIKKEGNKFVNGSIMDEAEGLECDEIAEIKKSNNISDNNMFLTPAALKQVSDLMVFDFILGQMDRHDENFKLQLDQNELNKNKRIVITGITGIDNDMSFTDPSMIAIKNGTNRLETIYKIGAISGELADKIRNINMEMVKYELLDLGFTDNELSALDVRINLVKDYIENAEQNHLTICRSQEDWKKQSLATIQTRELDEKEDNKQNAQVQLGIAGLIRIFATSSSRADIGAL